MTTHDSPESPKAMITDIFRIHPECFDVETRKLISEDRSPFELDELHYVSDKEESKAIDASNEPAVIISASGMCEAGRIIHHLKATIENPKNTVLIVGYQAQHTLGRRIVERRQRVKIFGVERELRAEVCVMNGFSAHADQKDLVAFVEEARTKGGKLDHIALVHGDPQPQKILSSLLKEDGFKDVRAPAPHDVMSI